MKNRYILIFLITALMTVYYGRIDLSYAPCSDIPDIQNYRQMALASPGFDETVSRNFGYRILMPYIAGFLPFDVDMSFYILTLIMAFVIPFVLLRFFKEYGLGDDTSFYLTVIFLAGRYVFGFAVWNFYDVHDLLTHILILIFLISLKKNNFLIMGTVLAVGVANRETVLFLAPASAWYYFMVRKDKYNGIRFLISVIPALIILAGLRSLIVTESAAGEGLLYSFGKLRFDETNKLFDPVTYYRIINTFIPLTFIPFVFWKETKDLFRRNMHFLILIITYYASCFLAGDTERLIVPVFPVFFLLLGVIFEKYRFYELKGRILVLSACLISIPHHIYFRFRLPHRDWKVAVSLITLAAVTYYFYRFKKAKNNVLDSHSHI
ncbi:MAG: hypothetical protein PHF33_06660 [Candidatus Delongbacteria bacterium]|nr:hypothetical protein [Candidatus Delongbacteria bacterium]